MKPQVYLAIDLGAESGRIMAGLWDGKRIRVEDIHRFPNEPVEIAGTLCDCGRKSKMASPWLGSNSANKSNRLGWIRGASILSCCRSPTNWSANHSIIATRALKE